MSDLRPEPPRDSDPDDAPQGAKVYDRPKRPGGSLSTLTILVIAAILIVLVLLFVL